MIGLEERFAPRPFKGEGAIDEERRLLYVGLLRARHPGPELCRHRIKYCSATPCTVSFFVRDVLRNGSNTVTPPELMRRWRARPPKPVRGAQSDAFEGLNPLNACVPLSHT